MEPTERPHLPKKERHKTCLSLKVLLASASLLSLPALFFGPLCTAPALAQNADGLETDGQGNLYLGPNPNKPGQTHSIHFHPGDPYLQDWDVFIWCDTDPGADHWGHCHFNNLLYGNSWDFNGPGNFTGALNALSLNADHLQIGKTPVSLTGDATSPKLEFPQTTDPYITNNTLIAGGRGVTDYAFSKWSCFNISGGDQGGVCQSFGDYSDPEWDHRGGAGLQDGINVSAETANSSPIDVIGGGLKSADGTVYTVTYTQTGVTIKPKLSDQERKLLTLEMRIWSNMTNGTFATTTSGTNPDDRNTQVANYYLGYYFGIQDTDDSTTLTVKTNWIQNANVGWYLTNFGGSPTTPAAAQAPGANSGDVLDTNLPGSDPVHTTGLKAPAIMLGGPDQVFNKYTLERYDPNGMSRVSSYDNEYDHWMHTTADNQVVSRGLTIGWGGSNAHRLATGSWMLRLAGFNVQPIGLWIGGIYPGGYMLKTDDAFVNLSYQGSTGNNLGDTQFVTGLGQGVDNESGWGRLAFYLSRDQNGPVSYHLGLSKSGWSQGNQDTPDCDGHCTQTGQLVFEPAGYQGGVGLGTSHGAAGKTGLVVDADNRTHAISALNLPSPDLYTLQTSDCGGTVVAKGNIVLPSTLPLGCHVSIIPQRDGLTVTGGAYTVVNWEGGVSYGAPYTMPKAYGRYEVVPIEQAYNETYYVLSRSAPM